MSYLTTVLHDQRIRFLIVGAWNTIASYLIFVGVHISIGPKLGNVVVVAVAYALALPLSFFMQKLFVFPGDGAWLKQFSRFVVANSAVFMANLLFLPLFVKITGLGVLFSQAVFVLASTVISYFAHKHFSFAG